LSERVEHLAGDRIGTTDQADNGAAITDSR
jgi:hypothetical protein